MDWYQLVVPEAGVYTGPGVSSAIAANRISCSAETRNAKIWVCQKIGYPNFFKKVIRWYTPKFQTKPFCLLKSKGLFVLDGSSPIFVDQWRSKPPKLESSVFRYRLQEERFCSMNHMQLDTRFQGAGAILDWNVWLCMLPLTYICLYTIWDLWKSGARRKSEPLGTDWSHRKSKDLWGYVFGLKGPSMTVADSTCGFTGFDWS